MVWPLSLSLATTHKISVDFSSWSYLDVSVQTVPLIYLSFSVYDAWTLLHADCSIRISVLQRSLTATHSFSQLTTSFFGSWCQGIRPALLSALPFASYRSWVLSNLLWLFFSCVFDIWNFSVSPHFAFLLCFLFYSVFKLPSISFLKRIYFNKYFFKHQTILFVNMFCIYSNLFFLNPWFEFLYSFGGHKWTRTTDLTLIRRAL